MKKKKKGCSTQELIGIKSFTKYGLKVGKQEMLFFLVQPTNISVLSTANVENKIRQLRLVFSSVPYLEILCTDSCECFDDNKNYLRQRCEKELNTKVKNIIEKDIDFLDAVQSETATSRQFVFVLMFRGMKSEQVVQSVNSAEKIISEQGFEVQRMNRQDIKKFLAIYFDASLNGDSIPDYDGQSFIEEEKKNE